MNCKIELFLNIIFYFFSSTLNKYLLRIKKKKSFGNVKGAVRIFLNPLMSLWMLRNWPAVGINQATLIDERTKSHPDTSQAHTHTLVKKKITIKKIKKDNCNEKRTLSAMNVLPKSSCLSQTQIFLEDFSGSHSSSVRAVRQRTEHFIGHGNVFGLFFFKMASKIL